MTDPNPELTLSDLSWLTALARTLTRDRALADDLVQETWLVAQRSEPSTGLNRPWLSRVLRRLYLRSLRTESRRSVRERVASGREALKSTEDLVERAELHRTLADCLVSLEEPYRTTLMLVAFEGQTPQEIADRESVSVKSVRRRLRKARELFREKLEREYGRDWKQWYAVLLPYAELPLPGEVAAGKAAVSSGALTTQKTLGGLIMSHSVLVAATLAIVGGLSVMTLFPDDERAEIAVDSPLVPDGNSNDVLMAELSGGTAQIDAAGLTRLPLETTEEQPVVEDSEPTPGSNVLSGTLVMRDPDGREEAQPNGEFHLWTSKGNQVIPVVNGAWQLELTADQEFNFRRRQERELVISGRAGTIVGGAESFAADDHTIAQDIEVALQGRWLRNHALDVLDAETREHVGGVEVVECPGDSFYGFVLPDDIEGRRVVHENAYSPVRIEPQSKHRDTYYVGAPGYAWSQVEIDHEKGGRTEVALTPGADLRVRIRSLYGGPVDFGIFSAEWTGSNLEREVSADEELWFRGLPLKTYIVRARSDERGQIVSTEIEVQQGFNEVVLEVPPYVETLAPVAGTLLIGEDDLSKVTELIFMESWDTDLRIEYAGARRAKSIPVSQMERIEGGLRFDAGELHVGTYTAELRGVSWDQEFVLDSAGATDLRFELTKQGEALVRLLESSTLEAVGPSPKGFWHDPEFSLGEGVSAEFDESARAWRLRAPRGFRKGRVVFYYGFRATNIEVEFAAEPALTEVSIDRHTTVRVDLACDGERVEFPFEWLATLKSSALGTGAQPAGGVTLMDPLGWGFSVPRVGPQAISFGELEGYEPIPDLWVDVEYGTHTEYTLELTRK